MHNPVPVGGNVSPGMLLLQVRQLVESRQVAQLKSQL